MPSNEHTNESVIAFLRKFAKELDSVNNADALEGLRDDLQDFIDDDLEELINQYPEDGE